MAHQQAGKVTQTHKPQTCSLVGRLSSSPIVCEERIPPDSWRLSMYAAQILQWALLSSLQYSACGLCQDITGSHHQGITQSTCPNILSLSHDNCAPPGQRFDHCRILRELQRPWTPMRRLAKGGFRLHRQTTYISVRRHRPSRSGNNRATRRYQGIYNVISARDRSVRRSPG